jgi:hypothetical protein
VVFYVPTEVQMHRLGPEGGEAIESIKEATGGVRAAAAHTGSTHPRRCRSPCCRRGYTNAGSHRPFPAVRCAVRTWHPAQAERS